MLVALCLLAVILTFWQHTARRGGRDSAPERLAQRVVWPLQAVITSATEWSHDVVVSLTRSRSLTQENRELREQVDRLEAEKLQLHAYYLENKELKDALGFVIAGDAKGVPARAIGRSSSPGGTMLTVKSLDGRTIEAGNMVRTQKGLLGRVVTAQKTVGEVLLVSHTDHAVPGVVQRSGDQGMVYSLESSDYTEPLLQMEKLRGEADVRVGDIIVTSAISEMYPPNVPIGVVIRLQTAPASSRTLRAVIKPAADLGKIDYVLVVRGAR